jgi:hypothetical protein
MRNKNGKMKLNKAKVGEFDSFGRVAWGNEF